MDGNSGLLYKVFLFILMVIFSASLALGVVFMVMNFNEVCINGHAYYINTLSIALRVMDNGNPVLCE